MGFFWNFSVIINIQGEAINKEGERCDEINMECKIIQGCNQ